MKNKISDYDYHLPESLIAQFPKEDRESSRLLVAEGDNIEDKVFKDIIDYIEPGDLLVINNTRVLPARVFAHKETGGAVEILVERLLTETSFLAQTRASKSPKVGQVVYVENEPVFKMIERDDAFFIYETVDGSPVFPILERMGHMPLPPYITRNDSDFDKERYQTVFNKEKGAVAAPTAGLHFTKALMKAIEDKGASFTEVTLHVGAGTFKPVREEDLDKHVMHKEWISVSRETVDKIKETQANGKKVIAVGTTVCRSLETAALDGELKPFEGDTNIFIKPGFEFHVIDALVTNFHLPKSTLLVLVSMFMGYDRIQKIYQHAVEDEYRFFSYGDAMLLMP